MVACVVDRKRRDERFAGMVVATARRAGRSIVATVAM